MGGLIDYPNLQHRVRHWLWLGALLTSCQAASATIEPPDTSRFSVTARITAVESGGSERFSVSGSLVRTPETPETGARFAIKSVGVAGGECAAPADALFSNGFE